MTQLEEKKMLAEFMGWSDATLEIEFDDFNDLIQVVQTIETLNYKGGSFHVNIGLCSCSISTPLTDDPFDGEYWTLDAYENTKWDAVYRACVEFVKWWNEQNEKEVK